ncbi:ABC transporter type 1, transmembrane domain-containing protein [Naematelia encephala]|uniref:ABC transporter type 1, transmembrane domain-containing protein n=1 Tax=Naematelia encephala TaxID=71784 RepID=A0A1Y2BBH5_9TREE|nr:ABC transporter type 1, transmembrane domain-containing protein [Naematelia encephala]
MVHMQSWPFTPVGECNVFWDGTDFTPCFRQEYLARWPFVVMGVSAITLVLYYIVLFFASRTPPPSLSSSTLISPTAKSNLAQLEADVILGAIAANLLPPKVDVTTDEKAVPPDEAVELIEDYKSIPAKIAFWNRLRGWLALGGGLVWFGVELARCIVQGGWWGIAFPIFFVLITLLPAVPLCTILTLHLIPALIEFRSLIVAPGRPGVGLAPPIVELVFWALLISVPYAEDMTDLLAGINSRGGGSSGSYGSKLPSHPEEPTSVFSRATYTFMLPFLFKHYFTPIKLEDIPALREDDSAASSLGAFRAYQARRDAQYAKKHKNEQRKRRLPWDLLSFFAGDLFLQAAWATLFVCLQYLPPTGLRLLLQYVSERDTNPRPGHVAFMYVAMMVIGQTVGVTAMGQALYLGRRLCIRLRAIIIAEVFTKALRRQDLAGSVKKATPKNEKTGAPAQEAGATDGKINNLVAVDSFQISEICAYAFYIWSCPFAIVINSILLYNTLGVAAFAGIAVLVILLPVHTLISSVFTIVQRRFMGAVDVRLEAVTEVIAHIKLIKFNAWETKFFDRMMVSRRNELKWLWRRYVVNLCYNSIIWATPILVTVSAFAVHALVLKKPLTADRAFSSLILFNMLRDPMGLLQDTITRVLQSYVSCNRIQDYLDEPDTLKYSQLSTPGPDDPSVGFSGAVVSYLTSEDINEAEFEPFQLGELDLSFPVGQLSVITGPVGSGKTTLILALLGETMLLKGKVFMPDDHANRDICPIDPATGLSDTVAFCAQTPWLIGASIRDNIVFGCAWDAKRYNAVVDACALRKDFEIFELEDETEVGEKGTTCSGGQKARIALARALYSPAKTVILDDVLSAVDAQTARHLHVHCLKGTLMRGRTCILVSHAIPLVAPSAAYIVSLDGGRVTAAGPPSELASVLDLPDDEESTSPSSSTLTPDSTHDIIEENLDGIEADALEMQKQVEADKAAKADKKLVSSELQAQGSVGWGTYVLYYSAMGRFPYWVLLITAFFASQGLQVATTAWIKDWANAVDRRQRIHAYLFESDRSTQFYLGVYCAIGLAFVATVAMRIGLNYYGGITASKRLYKKLLKRVLGAKMRFFDSTPSGRIMNRLSKDVSSIDLEAAEIMLFFAQCIMNVAAVLAVIIFSTPLFLVALILIAVLYWAVGTIYVTTSREIKRFDSVTRSPFFVSFSEALVGMSTIRSYGDSARFMRKLFQELDQNTRCFWYLWQANRVLNNFSNFVGSLVTIFACLLALRNPKMDAGAVGLSITYALSFTEYVLWVVRLYAASQMAMNSVERVAEYLELEVEEEDHAKGAEPPAYWPSQDGSVVVEDLTCRYAPQLTPVLRGVSFTIKPKEKIGICGRTGSGKSTLALSFFRFLHQESGSIIIDGLDISKLSLATLRSRLTILPQEAQLFSGTIRDNLDPFDQHEDMEVWEALRQCGLAGRTPGTSRAVSRSASAKDLPAQKKDKDLRVQSLKNLQAEALKPGAEQGDEAGEEEVEERVVIRSLDEKVAVGGKNFSEDSLSSHTTCYRLLRPMCPIGQGQRQLLALARGLLKLRNSNFLIMDESTANLDHATDMTIQNVLRTGLADTQMLVIAHRLMTVAGLDKILVLDHGKVLEFGTPWELMQNEEGTFRDLCRQSGEEKELFEMAKNVHEAKLAAAQ